MSVNVLSLQDWIAYINNEVMDEIWLVVEDKGLGVYTLFGKHEDHYYMSCDRWWNPIYKQTYEDFLSYIETFGVYDVNALVKIK